MWVSRPHPLGQDTDSHSVAPGSAAASPGNLMEMQSRLLHGTPCIIRSEGGAQRPPPGDCDAPSSLRTAAAVEEVGKHHKNLLKFHYVISQPWKPRKMFHFQQRGWT